MTDREEVVELRGHIIDSLIFSRVLDTIMEMGGDFEILEFKVGKRKTDPSFAKILVKGKDPEHLREIISELRKYGAIPVHTQEVRLEPAPADGVCPRGFYTTTNHRTFVFFDGEWIEVEDIEMDCAIVIYPEERRAVAKPIREVREGELVVVGDRGVRVKPPERPRGRTGIFGFMESEVSPEKPTLTLIRRIAEELEWHRKNGKVVVVVGPAVIHAGARDDLAWMIKEGYVDVLFAGNAVATHDVEASLFGTSLGVDLETGEPVKGGHSHHLYAINEIRRVGGLREAVEKGILKDGIMYECIVNDVPYVLAGSIRDDGPIPDVITDVMEAQAEMRRHLKGATLVLMMATMLHSIATGNLLPSWVKTICVDINPAVVTKLMDRGTAQALGIVSDVGVFLPELVKELKRIRDDEA
ncbi:TIGR00300 family protein [Methanopyrus sp. SNP6]|uniref:ornithine cyclodeaminase n=1 Tax=Methanopyrus sp. SNP6 TaxID=1937005 RepID=UPI0011E588BF|nr:TIGR00300 family protein [Methanopyrus sp. SNP6]